MSTKKFLVITVLFLAVTGIASAAHYLDSGNHLWNDPANWLAGTVPGAADEINFVGWMGSPEVCNIGSGVNAVAGQVYVGYSTNSITTTLNVSGTGTLNVTGDVRTAFVDDATTGNMNVSDDAVVNIGGYLIVAQQGMSTFTMTGNASVTATGLWNSMWVAGSVGHMYLSGNSILTTTSTEWDGFYWGDIDPVGTGGAYYSDPHMDISENATLSIATGNKEYALGLIADGRLTANGGGLENFLITDLQNGQTIFQVPEPMTLSLLAFGGLLLRRKS